MVRWLQLSVCSSVLLLLASFTVGAEIQSVTPNLCLAANAAGVGGTLVTVKGSGFASTMSVRLQLGGVAKTLLGLAFEGRTGIFTGRVPDVSPGIYNAQLLSAAGGVLHTLNSAVEVAAPVQLTSVVPGTVARAGGTPVTVNGTSFRDVTVVRFGTHPLLRPVVSADGRKINGDAPPLGAGELDGPYDVVAEDSRGQARLVNGVTYETPFSLLDVTPKLVSTLGGAELTFLGEGFHAGMVLSLGGSDLTNVTVLDDTTAKGKTQSLAAGLHDAADADDNGSEEITDAILILSYLFTGGRAPAAPGPERCGEDPSADDFHECAGVCR